MQDLNDKVTGGTLTAAEWNEVPSEIQNVITDAGLTLDGGDLSQLLKSIYHISRISNLGVDSGVADAYVITSSGQANTAYTDGMIVTFNALNANTSTSTINVDGLGVKNIRSHYGSTLGTIGGMISGITSLIYDGVGFAVIRTLKNNETLVSVDAAELAVIELIKANVAGSVEVGDEDTPMDILGETEIRILLGVANELGITLSENGGVFLYYNGTQQALRTSDRTSSSSLSGAQVLDCSGTQQFVGFNELPLINSDVTFTLLREHSGKLIDFEGVAAQTYTPDIDGNLPDGWTVMIQNRGTDTLAIAENASGTTQFMDGSGALASGARTLAIAGMCTITKLTTNEYVIFGNGLS